MTTPTSRPHDRLAELGLVLPPVVAAMGSYVPAVRTGALVYTAGQIPLVDGELRFAGRVGDAVAPDLAAEQAAVCALNALAAIDDLVGLGAVRRVVKVTGFVAAAPGFTAIPAVVNGASDLLTAVFGDDGRHARSAVGVAQLPLDAPVEVELIVEIEPLAELAELAADEGVLVGDADLPVDVGGPADPDVTVDPDRPADPLPPAGLPA